MLRGILLHTNVKVIYYERSLHYFMQYTGTTVIYKKQMLYLNIYCFHKNVCYNDGTEILSTFR